MTSRAAERASKPTAWRGSRLLVCKERPAETFTPEQAAKLCGRKLSSVLISLTPSSQKKGHGCGGFHFRWSDSLPSQEPASERHDDDQSNAGDEDIESTVQHRAKYTSRRRTSPPPVLSGAKSTVDLGEARPRARGDHMPLNPNVIGAGSRIPQSAEHGKPTPFPGSDE